MYHHSADNLIVQILAWMSEQDVHARLLAQMDSEDKRESLSQSLQKLVQLCLEDAVSTLSAEPVFGPALLDLARQRLAEVNFESPAASVARAIAVEGLLEAGHALFYLVKEEGLPSLAVPRPTPEDTRLLVAHLAENGPCTARLKEMGQQWHGDVCQGASSLRLFFLGYLDLRQWIAPVPSFLLNLLRDSLSTLDWHLVAAQILLGEVPGAECRCAALSEEELSEARAALLRERLTGIGYLLAQGSQDAPESQRTLVLFLADLCQQAGWGTRTSEPAAAEDQP